jgi:hypothetical protein
MAGFNLPITAYTPQMLAEMAKAAFRPPALMGGGGGGLGGGGVGAAAQGFNVGQGMAGMGQGLGSLAGAFGKGDPTSVIPAEGATLGGGPAGGMTTVGPGGVYSVTGLEGGSFGGGLADGGPVMPGQYYTVGERGPETFVPAVPGHIVPRDFFGGRRRR